MPKIEVHCDWCGTIILRHRSRIGKHCFCSSDCRSKFLSKKSNPDNYPKHEHLSQYNKEHNNERMTPEVRAKLRECHLMSRKVTTYAKIYGQHVHRFMAEKMIGRKLKPGEIVHHIDGDKQNNHPDNLAVLPSQSAHMAIHRTQGDLRRR